MAEKVLGLSQLKKTVPAVFHLPHGWRGDAFWGSCSAQGVAVADDALPVALLAQPADGDAGLLAAHDEVRMVLCHGLRCKKRGHRTLRYMVEIVPLKLMAKNLCDVCICLIVCVRVRVHFYLCVVC